MNFLARKVVVVLVRVNHEQAPVSQCAASLAQENNKFRGVAIFVAAPSEPNELGGLVQ